MLDEKVTNDTGPLVTVIIPSYNREKTIARAIESVLRQSYKNIELLVVDDGSTDGTVAIVLAYSDSRIRLIRLPKNAGVSVARNRGFDEAKGEFVAFQDSDDEWLPRKLERQLRLSESHPETGVFSCSLIRLVSSESHVRKVPENLDRAINDNDLSYLLEKNYAWTQTWLLRRNVVDSGLRFDPSITCIQDWDYVIGAAARFGLKLAPEVLVIAHETEGSLLSQIEKFCADLQKMLENNMWIYKHHPRVLAEHSRTIARWFAIGRDTMSYKKWTKKALALQPSSPIYLSWFVLSLFGAKTYLGLMGVRDYLRSLSVI